MCFPSPHPQPYPLPFHHKFRLQTKHSRSSKIVRCRGIGNYKYHGTRCQSPQSRLYSWSKSNLLCDLRHGCGLRCWCDNISTPLECGVELPWMFWPRACEGYFTHYTRDFTDNWSLGWTGVHLAIFKLCILEMGIEKYSTK